MKLLVFVLLIYKNKMYAKCKNQHLEKQDNFDSNLGLKNARFISFVDTKHTGSLNNK